MNKDFDVAIVGGGAAGIGAARRLAKSTLSAVLIEASARLGGRAWTQEIAGLNIDLGCGWFHSAERNAWVDIAAATGIEVDRRKAQWGIQHRNLGFSQQEQAEAKRAMETWMLRLRTSPPPSDCAADALEPGGPWNDYIRTIAGFISGGSLETLSVADYLAYDDASSEHNWRTPAGFGSMVVRSVPPQTALRLSTPLESIALHSEGVTLQTPAGAVRARVAIFTVSTAVLAGDILKLPRELQPWREAARVLPLGRDEKFFLRVAGGPFENETQVLGNPRDACTASYYIRPLGSPLIECFFGGEGARFVEENGPAAGFDFAIGQLCTLFGSDARSSLHPLLASNWSRMQYIGGAYSYALPGHRAARLLLQGICKRRDILGSPQHGQLFDSFAAFLWACAVQRGGLQKQNSQNERAEFSHSVFTFHRSLIAAP